jgi:hypothetical protein
VFIDVAVLIHQFREPQNEPLTPTKVLFRNADNSSVGRSQYLRVRRRSITGEKNS